MKMIFISFFLSLSYFAASAVEGTVGMVEEKSVQRVASMVEYVAVDYKEAVGEGGRILSQSEYEEQRGLLQDAYAEVVDWKAADHQKHDLLQDLDTLRQVFLQKKSPADVLALSRKIRVRLEQSFGLRMQPSEHVSIEAATPLYQQYCASCHGVTGRADTEIAKALNPAPVSFLDEERMRLISPTLAYHAMSFGIRGTGMPSFDTLPSRDRWNLAFYVLSLRHTLPLGTDETRLAERVRTMADAKVLAGKSDDELLDELRSFSTSPDDLNQLLAYLRTRAFGAQQRAQTPVLRFSALNQILRELLKSAEEGQMKQAYEYAASAYLDEFEPFEGVLRSKNADLVASLEGLFQELRQATKQSPVNLFHLRELVGQISEQLNQAEVLLAGEAPLHGQSDGVRSFWSLFAPVLGITLREGFEVVLLVSFLLAYLRKSGRTAQTGIVHMGWGAAVVAGFGTYIVTYLVLKQAFSGEKRELIEAISTFVALAILVPLTHSILGAKEAKQWLGFLGKKLDSLKNETMSAPSVWGKFALFGIAFFAVYREMVETILFYRPYLQDGTWFSQQALGLGILAGLAIIAAVAGIIYYTGKRLNPRPVMRISSFFLGAICVSLAGQGMHALQEAGVLASSPMLIFGHRLPSIPILGIYASWPGMLLQLLVILILVVPTFVHALQRQNLSNR